MNNAPNLEGRLLGGAYRIGRLLGQGAMGAVYEAMHERLGRPVAVKVLLRGNGPLTPEQVQRFEREARAAAALGHPNIVQVTDFQWISGEPPVLVMERLAGESLGSLLERTGPLAPDLACFLGTQILDALSAAHHAGIVHRDIKPDNVCLVPIGSGTFVVKVVDFGLAKVVGETPMTSHGTLLGTPAYMAPEQALGHTVDGRADVYAVGATLYHVLSGRLPVDESTPIHAIIEQIVRVPPPPLARVVPGFDPALSLAIERAMAKDPSQRFQSAEAFRAALAPFVRAMPSVALPPTSRLAQSVGAGSGPGALPPGPHGPTSPSPGVFLHSAPSHHAPSPPSPKSRSGCLVAGVGLGALCVLLVGGVGVALYVRSDDASTASASPTATRSAAVVAAPVDPKAPLDAATPPATATVPASGPTGRATKKDAGPDDAGSPVMDAGTPLPVGKVRRVMTRSSADMSPFGTSGQAALAAADSALGLFAPCASTACLRKDLVVRDEPWAAIDVRYTVDASGDAKPSGFSPMLPSGPACPAYEQCLARRAGNVKFPKAQAAGKCSFTLLVVERPEK